MFQALSFGHLTHTSSANSMWDVRAGKYVWSQDISRVAGDLSAPGRRFIEANRPRGGWMGQAVGLTGGGSRARLRIVPA